MKEPRIWFGFGLLIVISGLAICIALGKVTQQDSYGLDIVLGALAVLAGSFANWAFGRPPDSPK